MEKRAVPRSRPHRAGTAASKPAEQGLPAGAPPRAGEDCAIVALGASAGGLEACIKFLKALPPENGMAFILVQHLDPNHQSLMVELLAGHTAMSVRQAATGLKPEPDHLYIIPPGTYLSIKDGALLLSPPQARHGARMPFDFLLRSLAEAVGPRTICVILSGTGADGSLGAMAVKEHCGLVIAQAPDEAEYDGMPRSAIQTGAVDLVLPIAEMPAALLRFARTMSAIQTVAQSAAADAPKDWLPRIIDLLRTNTAHDFSLYKQGTLQRRIERRMAMAAIEPDQMERYLDLLRTDPAELELLARDLLINVTCFFRDTEVFSLLERSTIPDLIKRTPQGHPLRIWVAACSTGQETYSLAMLFIEQIAALRSSVKLQLFASDADPDAVAIARAGLYPESIETEISPERLKRFFDREEHGYRVQPALRSLVVFTVQDVLSDPPFSRLDMVSCRNLLIYLQPEAQAKVLSLFHFALRDGGFLLLGNSETIGAAEQRFEAVSKPERLYRHVAGTRPGAGSAIMADGLKIRPIPSQTPASARQATLAELGRRLVLDCFAPAAILVSTTGECLYSLGPTDRYLRVAPGHHTNDLLAMARPGTRARLKSAIAEALTEQARIIVPGGRLRQDGQAVPFRIDVQPVHSAGQDLLLVCFVEEPEAAESSVPLPAASAVRLRTPARTADLEQELEATRAELRGVLRDLETSSEEQKAINEEALSVNEEFQSTNEELLTSKEELQSLNEELTALNAQLQETLERQRGTLDDLQNVLYSTDVATLFLDVEFRIRFFTPASKALFSIIPGDIGRPLADLHSLASDTSLDADAKEVLRTQLPVEREIAAPDGVWFTRRILPYLTHDRRVEGVVITFNDITDRKRAAREVDAAKQHAEAANLAKTRFLAAASHDLRQPLQTLSLLQGLLARTADTDRTRKLVLRQGETLAAMSGMLNTLLDINQIEAGVVQPSITRFPINDMLLRLRDEFTYHAQAQGLVLRAVPCSLWIESDPRLLEQMVRNLLSNALKYTRRGRVLLGCRRNGAMLSIEIWDTGIGIPGDQIEAIFEEYHQLDNAARERSRGMGLGLSIVQRLGKLLDHRIRVESRHGRGSVFAIEVARAAAGATDGAASRRVRAGSNGPGNGQGPGPGPAGRTGVILVIEDDPDIRATLQLCLQDEGHLVAITTDGDAALTLLARGTLRPDLIIADYNLPNGINGLQLALRLQENGAGAIPTIILTGDISAATMRRIADHNVQLLTKPVRLGELTACIQHLLPQPGAAAPAPVAPMIAVIDDDAGVLAATRTVLEDAGYGVETYGSGEAFLQHYHPHARHCLVIDACLPGVSGLDVLHRLRDGGNHVPAIVITGESDVAMAVQAMKAGATDFIEKPIGAEELLFSIAQALEQAQDDSKRVVWRADAAQHIASLTPRQHQIMTMVLAGQPSKIIAASLAISQRTVENHRAAIMRKTGVASLPALARLALAAGDDDEAAPAA